MKVRLRRAIKERIARVLRRSEGALYFLGFVWKTSPHLILTGTLLYQRWQLTHHIKPSVLIAGEHLHPLVVENIQDELPVKLDWQSDRRPIVLYIFAPSCIWCKKNLEAVRTLAAAASQTYRFYGISLTRHGLSGYLTKVHYQFPVYVAGAKARQLKLTGTPETIVISPDSVVTKVWLGAYMNETALDIEEIVGVKLPVVGF